ncbi:MAG: adenylate/guanylate cyclase domain-containing protein [Gammaproteobacteria bacterium]
MSGPISSARSPDAEAVRAELVRVLASNEFSNAPILSGFLRHVVERWIAGDDTPLKEYAIGVEVLHRGEAFDPNVDTIVRVHARRLRARLARYYAKEGRNDPIWITMPTGRYRVEIATRAAAETASASSGSPVNPGSPRFTICVLPFVNMSGDPEQEYFSDGITEDIITDLSKISALSVISRSTAFMYKGENVDIVKVAHALGASHVLEGSVRKAGGRMRISAQLIDGVSNHHVWAERYDRDFSDIFALQEEISHSIVKALKLRLLPEEAQAIEQHGTRNVEAHNLYLMARRMYVSNLEADQRSVQAIVRLCTRATEYDPNYAQAWALMAMGYRSLHDLGLHADDGTEAVERALALDPGLAEAHAIKAGILQMQGAVKEADFEVKFALDLDPESYEANRAAGRLAYQLHRFDDAVRHYEKAMRLMDSDVNSAMLLVSTYRTMGDAVGLCRAAEVALRRADALLAHDQSNSAVLAYSANALAALGESERAKERATRALLIDPDNWNMRYNFACALNAYLSDGGGALDMLEPLFATLTATRLRYLKDDPDFASLHNHPRYQAMVAAAEARLMTSVERTATPTG